MDNIDKYRGGQVPNDIGDLIIALADLGLKSGGLQVKPGVDKVLGWLTEPQKEIQGLPAMKIPHPRPPTVNEKNGEIT